MLGGRTPTPPLPKTVLFHCTPPLLGGSSNQFQGQNRRSYPPSAPKCCALWIVFFYRHPLMFWPSLTGWFICNCGFWGRSFREVFRRFLFCFSGSFRSICRTKVQGQISLTPFLRSSRAYFYTFLEILTRFVARFLIRFLVRFLTRFLTRVLTRALTRF